LLIKITLLLVLTTKTSQTCLQNSEMKLLSWQCYTYYCHYYQMPTCRLLFKSAILDGHNMKQDMTSDSRRKGADAKS